MKAIDLLDNDQFEVFLADLYNADRAVILLSEDDYLRIYELGYEENKKQLTVDILDYTRNVIDDLPKTC